MISPLRGDLSRLPPLLLQASECEMLLDDSLRLARRAHIYDVEVSVDIWRKVPHVWQAMGFLPESRDALEKAGAYIRNHVI